MNDSKLFISNRKFADGFVQQYPSHGCKNIRPFPNFFRKKKKPRKKGVLVSRFFLPLLIFSIDIEL
jgi:hypothetical protein